MAAASRTGKRTHEAAELAKQSKVAERQATAANAKAAAEAEHHENLLELSSSFTCPTCGRQFINERRCEMHVLSEHCEASGPQLQNKGRVSAASLLAPPSVPLVQHSEDGVHQPQSVPSIKAGFARKPPRPHVIFTDEQRSFAFELFHRVPNWNKTAAEQEFVKKWPDPCDKDKLLDASQLKSFFSRLNSSLTEQQRCKVWQPVYVRLTRANPQMSSRWPRMQVLLVQAYQALLGHRNPTLGR